MSRDRSSRSAPVVWSTPQWSPNAMAQLLALDLPAPHGMLEALLRLPDPGTTPRMAALVCHPHPAQGGTMHNKVVFRIAQALGELDMPTLRFNYRGVGRSTGSFDEGRGEADDVRTAR